MKIDYKCKRKRHAKIIRTAIIISVIISAAVIRMIFADEINSDSDRYISAFNALGNGLNGNQTLTESFKDAYEYAFFEKESELFYVSWSDDEEPFGY